VSREKFILRIVVDAKGNVSEAKALSGPEELIPPALAWVQKWQYEPLPPREQQESWRFRMAQGIAPVQYLSAAKSHSRGISAIRATK